MSKVIVLKFLDTTPGSESTISVPDGFDVNMEESRWINLSAIRENLILFYAEADSITTETV